MSVCPVVHLSVLSFCLSVCLSVSDRLSVCLFCLRSARAQTGWLLTAPGLCPRLQSTNCRPPPTALTPYPSLLYLRCPAHSLGIYFIRLKVHCVMFVGDAELGCAGVPSYFLTRYCKKLECRRAQRGGSWRTPRAAVLSYQSQPPNQFSSQLPISGLEKEEGFLQFCNRIEMSGCFPRLESLRSDQF